MKRLLLIAVLAFAVPASAADAAPRWDQACGMLPGDGAYSFVRVANVTCRHGKKVTNKARKKFCSTRNGCLIDWQSDITMKHRGTVYRNGWRCKVAVGWESIRVKCRKGKRRALWNTAA